MLYWCPVKSIRTNKPWILLVIHVSCHVYGCCQIAGSCTWRLCIMVVQIIRLSNLAMCISDQRDSSLYFLLIINGRCFDILEDTGLENTCDTSYSIISIPSCFVQRWLDLETMFIQHLQQSLDFVAVFLLSCCGKKGKLWEMCFQRLLKLCLVIPQQTVFQWGSF